MLDGSGRLPSATKRCAIVYDAVSTSIANVEVRSSSGSVTGFVPGSWNVTPSYGVEAGARGGSVGLWWASGGWTGPGPIELVAELEHAEATRTTAARDRSRLRMAQPPCGEPGEAPGRHGRGRRCGPAGPGSTPPGAPSGRPVDAGGGRMVSMRRR